MTSTNPSNIIGFWKDDEPYGFCSNWYPAGFAFMGTQFKTSEHWMMWQKARVMGDTGMEQIILDAPTPADAKALGRKVSNYDSELWDDVGEQLVYYCVREKFLASPELAGMLVETGSALLCEASPLDKVWGIGMGVSNPTFLDPSTWKGKNLLGRVLMRVRADLRLCGCELPERERMASDVLLAQVGGMSLLELSRVPAARAAVLCYAQVAAHLSGGRFSSAHDLLCNEQVPLREIDDDKLSAAGWRELLVQLAFLHHTGQL